MKTVRVAPFRTAVHDLYRAARLLRQSVKGEDIYKTLSDQKNVRQKAFSKQFLTCLLIFFITTSSDSAYFIIVKTPWSDFRTPKLYCVLAMAFLIAMSILDLISYFILNDAQRIIGNKMLKFNNSPALSSFYDSSAVWSLPLNIVYSFYESTNTHKTFSYISLFIIFLPFLVVYIMIYYYTAGFLLSYVFGPNYVAFGFVLSIVGLVFLVYPLTLLIFTLFPTLNSKNVMFIRWVFLTGIYRRMSVKWPPRSERWVDNEDGRD